MIGNFLGNVEKPDSYIKTAVATFWATFGLLFTPSGHTACGLPRSPAAPCLTRHSRFSLLPPTDVDRSGSHSSPSTSSSLSSLRQFLFFCVNTFGPLK